MNRRRSRRNNNGIIRVLMCLMMFCLITVNIMANSFASGSVPEANAADSDMQRGTSLPSATETLTTTVPTTSAETTTTTEYRPEVVLEHPYYIQVDKKAQVVTVFTTNEEGKYEKLVRQMICSTGEVAGKFPDGMYRLKDRKFEWRMMLSHNEAMYAQYACTITGDFLFHSVPYSRSGAKSSLYEWRFKELGTPCTGGCIRLTVEGAKWIFDNCPPGTPVCIMTGDTYDKDLIERLRPAAPEKGWDPTDPDPNNPNYQPLITTPDPQPDKYAPLYDYDWDWAPEVTKVAQRTTTTTAAPTTEPTTEATDPPAADPLVTEPAQP